MKRLVVIIVALCALMPAFGQTLKGKSNPVHLEITSKAKSSPPVMVWLSPEQTSSVITGAEVTIKVGINSTINLKNVTVLINGQPQQSRGFGVTSPDASKFTKFIEQKGTLSAGPNEIKIIAVNDNGETTTESRMVSMTPSVAIANAESRTDYALIIATNDYKDWSDLTNPVQDAKAIATELGENYGFKVEALYNASKQEIVTKIREYAKKNYNTDDQLFIFIAGHGQFDDIGKDGYIVARDSKLNDDTYDTYIPFSVLRTTIDNNPSKHVFLTMDVCFGGTFDQAIAKRGGDGDAMYTRHSPGRIH
ncbi:MAG: caspase family protein [Bacteroidota bacterium]